MKKFLFLLPVFMFCLCFVGCKEDIKTYLTSNVSEKCGNYYVGQTNDFYVNFFSGAREQTYKLDGVSTQTVPYAIVSVKQKTNVQFDELQYMVEIEQKTYEGALTENPYDGTFEADIGVFVEPKTEVFVYLKFNDLTEVSNLECVFESFSVSFDTALDIAVDELLKQKPELNKNCDYECFVQILNKDANAGMYFWLINIVSSDGEVFSIIVDTTTGEVLAKKL